MRQARGMKSQLIMAFESDYGILPSSPIIKKMPFNKNALTSKQSLIDSSTITGRRDPVQPGQGEIDVSGTIEVPVDTRNFGWWLTLAFGVPDTTNISTHGSLIGNINVDDTLTTWTAITDGAFSISIDGIEKEINAIDFSSAATITEVAGKIQSAIRAADTSGAYTEATVLFDETNKQFTITSGTTGNTSSVSLLSASTSGTDISTTMKCSTGTMKQGETLYQHEFKVKDNMPSCLIEKGFGDINSYAQYPGCKISKLTIDAQVGNNELTASLDMMGANEQLESASLDSSAAMERVLRLNNFNATVKEAGKALADARKCSIEIDFGVDGDTYCLNGNNARTDISEGIMKVSGSIEALFKNMDLLNKAINGTESSVELGFSSGSQSLKMRIPELIFERATPTIDGSKGVLQTLNYQGYFDDGADDSTIITTLVNDIQEYNIS